MSKIAKFIDHTVLRQNATEEEIIKLCEEAKIYHFASVCVNPCFAKLVKENLKDSSVKTCVVVGFPLGANTSETKAFETKDAVLNGAEEIDMVINIGKLKDRDYDYVENDIKAVVDATEGKALVKVIIETCQLIDDEKVKACELAVKAGAKYVKTSTGFSTGGANIFDISLMKKTVGENIGVKASGGIKTYDAAISMIEAGADRIGTSSGVKIIDEEIHVH